MGIDTTFTERALLREWHTRLGALQAVSEGLKWRFDYNPFNESNRWNLKLDDGKGLMLALPGGNAETCIDKAESLFEKLGLL